ncbi:unnamed protein product, partial [marine sediment metagenome]
NPKLATKATPEAISNIATGVYDILRAGPAFQKVVGAKYGLTGFPAGISRYSDIAAKSYVRWALEFAMPAKSDMAVKVLTDIGFSREAIARMSVKVASDSLITKLGVVEALSSLIEVYEPGEIAKITTELTKEVAPAVTELAKEVTPVVAGVAKPEIPEVTIPKAEVAKPVAEVGAEVAPTKLRSTIMAWGKQRGLSQIQLNEIFKKVVGQGETGRQLPYHLTRMTPEQLRETLAKVKVARPRRIRGKVVITEKTESKIQSLKSN